MSRSAGPGQQRSAAASRQIRGGVFSDAQFRFSEGYVAVDAASLPAQPTPRRGAGRGRPAAVPPVAADRSREVLGPATAAAAAAATMPSISGSRGAHARTVEQLPGASATDPYAEESQRLRKTELQAATLLRYARSRKPQVAPVFAAERPAVDAPAEQHAVSAGLYKPTTRPLMMPSLGPAAGVAAGTAADTGLYALTPAEQAGLLRSERQANEQLFEWWDERATARRCAELRDRLSRTLQPALESTAKDMIADEESHWLRQSGGASTRAVVNPKWRKPVGGASGPTSLDLTAQNNGLTAVGATDCGVIVSNKELETLFRGVRAKLHERASTLLAAYDESQAVASGLSHPGARQEQPLADATRGKEDDPVPSGSACVTGRQVELERSAQEAYMSRLRETEAALAQDAVHADGVAALIPACVSLPPERMLQPLVVVETAVAVALLWKILEQVRTVVPGMDFGLQLCRHYVMPHLYDRFAAHSDVLPRQSGSLSSQVGRLCALPLRANELLLADEAIRESREDVRYMEYAMKHWALRTWRASTTARKCRERARQSCVQLLTRASRRAALRAAFDAWRLQAHDGAHAECLDAATRAFHDFLAGSVLPPDASGPSRPGGAADGAAAARRAGSARQRATTLAEAANHSARARSQKPPRSDASRAAASTSETRLPALNDSCTMTEEGLVSSRANSRASARFTPARPASRNETPDTLVSRASPAPVPTWAGLQGPFGEIMARLRDTEEICTHLRDEISVQGRMLRNLEQEKRGLQERNRQLEADLLRTIEEKLHYCNVVQERQLQLQESARRVAQLKSRVRAHHNRPWQRTVMRLMGEVCGASTQLAEAMDDGRLRRDGKSDATPAAGSKGAAEQRNSDADGKGEGDALVDDSQFARDAEQERLFGQLAPIVLSSTHSLPDALIILQDWANSCLDDLESLDDLKGGALSVRFSGFSEEVRSGVLLSRLLFYLALPRYLRRTATNTDDGPSSAAALTGRRGAGSHDDGRDGAESRLLGCDYADRRRQLLDQRNVQLDAPFPVYSECFGDLLSMRPSERMTELLHFATQLVAGVDAATLSDALALKREAVEQAVKSAIAVVPPPPAAGMELEEVVDPHALSSGERVAVVTLVALLYTRFAHPFNHKSRQSAVAERAAIVYLLSGGPGGASSAALTAAEGGSAGGASSSSTALVRAPTTAEEELLAGLDDEDKSPWQLFKERCLPVFGTGAHPFLLRGNFWPSDAFDSPSLAGVLGELGLALSRSLQLHRWHVTLSCLVPVTSYTGLSRGVFSGPRASPAALQIGLQRGGDWAFPLHGACVRRLMARRHAGCLADGTRSSSHGNGNGNDAATVAGAFEDEKAQLMAALRVSSNDQLELFLRYATLSPDLALPVLSLSGWRLLCGAIGLVALDIGAEDTAPLDLESATAVFFDAIAALEEAQDSDRPLLVPVTGAMPAPAGAAAEGGAPHRRQDSSTGSTAPAEEAGVERASSAAGSKPTPTGDARGFVALPPLSTSMTFPAFATAMVITADLVYPAPTAALAGHRTESAPSRGEEDAEDASLSDSSVRGSASLGAALAALLGDHVLRAANGNALSDEPLAVAQRLRAGVRTQEVLTLYAPALTLVYHAYSRDVYGSAGMEKDDVLVLLRDAMLTSTEISQYLVGELFNNFCVVRRVGEEDAAGRRRELDGHPHSAADGEKKGPSGQRAGARSVSIVDPKTHGIAPSMLSPGRGKDVSVLTMEGFVDLLCVLCHFKQPNPLIPLHQRLGVFIRRSVLRPLDHTVDGVATFLGQLRGAKGAATAADDDERTGAR